MPAPPSADDSLFFKHTGMRRAIREPVCRPIILEDNHLADPGNRLGAMLGTVVDNSASQVSARVDWVEM